MKKFKFTKKTLRFVRFGNLNPVKHKEARRKDEDRTYHSAPCYKGIYAFPEGLVERFLLGVSDSESFNALNVRIKFLKDSEGNIIKDDEKIYTKDFKGYNSEFKKFLKKNHIKERDIHSVYVKEKEENYLVVYCNKHVFSPPKYFWHHLVNDLPEGSILDRKGSWVKSSYDDYLVALKRNLGKEKFESYRMLKGSISGDPAGCPNLFSRDHLEVFCERV